MKLKQLKVNKVYKTKSNKVIKVIGIHEHEDLIFLKEVTGEKKRKSLKHCIQSNFLVKELPISHFPEKIKTKNDSFLKINNSIYTTEEDKKYLNDIFTEIANGVVLRTYDKPNSVRTHERLDYFNEKLKEMVINKSKIISFEDQITILEEKKNVDAIVRDINIRDKSTCLSFVFPCQSIVKNMKNYIEHVSDPVMASLSKGNDVFKGMGLIFLPTKTLNKKDDHYVMEDVLGNYNRGSGKYIKEIRYSNDKGHLVYRQYVIFYVPTDEFFDVIRNANAVEDIIYVKGIYNLETLMAFNNDLNS